MNYSKATVVTLRIDRELAVENIIQTAKNIHKSMITGKNISLYNVILGSKFYFSKVSIVLKKIPNTMEGVKNKVIAGVLTVE